MRAVIEPFLAATVRTATPLALAALGEVVVERAGMINVGLEGALIAGAFGALAGGTWAGVGAGYAVALGAGLLVAALFATCVIAFGADQIITGTALTLLGIGATGTLYRAAFGDAGAGLALQISAPIVVPVLSRIPVVGGALFAQPASTYLVYLLTPLVSWWMFRTHAGLALRAIGERSQAAVAAGVHVQRVRAGAILFGGALGGLAGGALVLEQAGTFVEGMSSGRGFIAIAIVVLGRWRPTGVLLGALAFGAASALQFAFQAMGLRAPYQLFLVAPYLVTLAALAGIGGRSRAPSSLGARVTRD